jgi:hypothetical protein
MSELSLSSGNRSASCLTAVKIANADQDVTGECISQGRRCPPGGPIVPAPRDVEEAIRDHERVWLVLHLRGARNSDRPKVAAMVRATLLQQFQLKEEQVFPGQPSLTVALYVRTAGEPRSY